MKARLDFWRNPAAWPRDSADFVFLGRAIHSIGKAIFSHYWTGDEPVIDLLPRRLNNFYFDHGKVNDSVVCKGRPPDRIVLRPTASEEWPLTVKLNAAAMGVDSELAPALDRFRSVQARIATLAEAGDLITASRQKVGGEMQPIPSPWWHTERLISRFDFCHLNPDDPFETGKLGGSYSWIFVARDGLSQSIAALEGCSTSQQSEQLDTAKIAKPVHVAKKEVEKEYRARVTSYEGKTPPTRAEDEAFCREALGVNRSRARELRKQLAPAGWQKAGPRKKKS
jgi:hypothetical protein